ncbi:hypothetical protein ACJX0J_028673, partial [Zea mays]
DLGIFLGGMSMAEAQENNQEAYPSISFAFCTSRITTEGHMATLTVIATWHREATCTLNVVEYLQQILDETLYAIFLYNICILFILFKKTQLGKKKKIIQEIEIKRYLDHLDKNFAYPYINMYTVLVVGTPIYSKSRVQEGCGEAATCFAAQSHAHWINTRMALSTTKKGGMKKLEEDDLVHINQYEPNIT